MVDDVVVVVVVVVVVGAVVATDGVGASVVVGAGDAAAMVFTLSRACIALNAMGPDTAAVSTADKTTAITIWTLPLSPPGRESRAFMLTVAFVEWIFFRDRKMVRRVSADFAAIGMGKNPQPGYSQIETPDSGALYQLDNAQSYRAEYRLCEILGVEFSINGGQVVVNSFLTDEQGTSDFFGG